MKKKRTLLSPGDVIRLGETDYRIEGVEGCGGSSVVYQAVYEDSLNSGQFHRVLIKELYPWTADSSVYRDEDGNICATPEGAATMTQSRESFYRGNTANLTLLRDMPDKISGNLNSYEAYGTYYSVLSLHGGKSLQKEMEKLDEEPDLRRMAEIMLQILDAVEGFHRAGVLHLDISPDNILLLPTYALLIDYNSVWSPEWDLKDFIFSEKQGYVSPEVRLRELGDIGPQSDLYSVAAIFFRMLTGRRLETDDLLGKGLKKSLRRDLPVFQNVPVTAAQKAVQIAAKGVHVVGRKRYQSAGEMRGEFLELLQRIDRKGITAASLWEGSRAEWVKQSKRTPAQAAVCSNYLEREIRTADGRLLPRENVYQALLGGGQLLLTGAGGMGKTEYLKDLWGNSVRVYRDWAPIVFYIPLSEYQEAGAEAYYIRKYLLRRLCLTGEEDLDLCLQELNRLLDGESAGGSWIFLLDGLNEAGTKTELLLKEIEEIAGHARAGVLLTDRTDRAKSYGLRGFEQATLQPLGLRQVEDTLGKNGLAVPENEKLLDALRNPMLLLLYIGTCRMRAQTGEPAGVRPDSGEARATADRVRAQTGESAGVRPDSGETGETAGARAGEPGGADQTAGSGRKRVRGTKAGAAGEDSAAAGTAEVTMEEIIGDYVDSLCLLQLRKDSGDEALQLRHRYLFEHLLPEIALTMQRKGRTLFTQTELSACLQKDYNTLRSKQFAAAFPDYLGKSRIMLAGIADEREWFDFAVSEQLAKKIGLLEETAEHSFHFLHDNFIDALAVRGAANRAKIQEQKRRVVLTRGGAAAGAAVVVAVILVLALPDRLSSQELSLLSSAALRLEIITGYLDTQIRAQEEVLDEMGESDVLRMEDRAISDLQEVLTLQLRTAVQAGTSYENYSDVSEFVSGMEALGDETLVSAYTEICAAPGEMELFLETNLAYMEEWFCTADNGYDEDDKEALLEAYTGYLDAYITWYYLRYSQVYVSLEELGAEEAAETLNEYMVDEANVTFASLITGNPLGSKTQEELAASLEKAQDLLDDAQLVLAQQGLYDGD